MPKAVQTADDTVLEQETHQEEAVAPDHPPRDGQRVALVVLSGDARRAHEAVSARYPGCQVVTVEKERLRGSDPYRVLARLRATRPERFVFFTYSNAWQLGRFKMLVFGWLSGARRVLFMDLEDGVEEFSSQRIWLAEGPRAVVEMLLALPLIIFSLLFTALLALVVKGGSKRYALNADSLDIMFLRPTPSTGVVEGGESAHITGVVGGLRSLGHRPRLLSNSRLAAVERAGYPIEVHSPSGLFASSRLAFELWNNLAFTWRVWRAIRRARPDALYQRYSRNNWSGPLVSWLMGIPLLLEWNGSEAWVGKHWSNLRWAWIIALYERVNRRAADRIVVVSKPLARALQHAGTPAVRIVVNPNGADPSRFFPGSGGELIRQAHGLEGKLVVGFAGTFNHYQGAPVLLRAASEVCRESDARLLIVGSGDELAEARDIAESSGLIDRVVFTGHVLADSVPAHIDACDIAVAPMIPNSDGSEFFNSPVKVFEYMTAGKAIVASRLGQLTEVLEHERTALLVEPNSPAELAAAILRLLGDEDLRMRLAANARRVALEEHTWVRNAERVVEALREVDSRQ